MNLQDLIDMEGGLKKPEEEQQPEKEEKKVTQKKSPKKDAKYEQASLLANSKSEAEGFASVEAEGYFKDEEGNVLKNMEQVLHDAMMPYAEYVIMDRALPRVEDGLKPVQRRILYSMYELGLTPDKPTRKCAKIVGDVLGSYHPHGDSSVYNALVRLAQDFNMREPLVYGSGNFGSMDGDSAAAYRYTDARLTKLSMQMLRDIDKGTVDWSKNYDDTKDEPNTLPGRFPNLLVNGTTGIAVGLATNIPTHNLGECIDASCAIIDNPEMTTSQIMKYIKGPDFPTGGIVMGGDGLKQAYETGRGKIQIRAKVHIEKDKDKDIIVIDEFPYQVNKAELLKKIGDLKDNNKELLSGIGEIRDESDRTGVRAVIMLKKGAETEKILNYLYKNTDLQTTFGINMVAIANAKPKQLSLKEILTYYVKYQREIIYRRTKFQKEEAESRAEILEGLLIAIKNIDDVVKIIKTSSSTAEARTRLMQKFYLTERQAQAILDMRLARLTSLEVNKITDELTELKNKIAFYKKVLADEKLQYQLVKDEMQEIKKDYGTKRKTSVEKDDEAFQISDDAELKPIKDIYVCYNERNCLKKIYEKGFNISRKSSAPNSTLNEVHKYIIKTKTNVDVILFTNLGNQYRVNIDNILEASWKERGSLLSDLFVSYQKDEKVVGMFAEDQIAKKELIFTTDDGILRKTAYKDMVTQRPVVSCYKTDGNNLVNVQIFEPNKTLLFATKNGIALNADISDVPVQSKTSMGLKGIKLDDDDKVVYTTLVAETDKVVYATDNCYAKIVPMTEVSVLGRNRKGVKIVSLGDGAKCLAYAHILTPNAFEVFALDEKDKPCFISTDAIPTGNRTAKGKQFSARKTIKAKKVLTYLWNI